MGGCLRERKVAVSSDGYISSQIEDDREQPVSSPFPEVGRVVFVNRRDVFGEFNLDEGRYVVIPSTFNPGLEKPFLMRIYTDKRIDAT